MSANPLTRLGRFWSSKRGWLRIFFDPIVFGPIWLFSLTLFSLLVDTNDVPLGANGQQIMGVIEGSYGVELRRLGAAILATAIASGALLGLGAYLVLSLRAWARPKAIKRLAHGALLVISLHAFAVARAMIEGPQLYASVFYGRGGWPRLVNVLLTDTLRKPGLYTILVVGLYLFVFGIRRTGNPTFRELGDKARELPKTLSERPAAQRSWAMAGRALFVAVIGGVVLVMRGSSPDETVRHADAQEAPTKQGPKKSETPNEAKTDASGEEQPNIVLLAVDSLRWDYLREDTVPKLNAIADRGTRFDRAYVSLPRTFPSWMTLLSSRWPADHGIRDMFPRWEDRQKSIAALPKRLQEVGYHTVVVSDFAGDIFRRVELGFDTVDTPNFNFRELIRQRGLERATPLLPFITTSLGRRVFPVLREFNQAADPFILADDVRRAIARQTEKPLFLTVFFSTAHFPYAAPYPYYQKYTDPDYRGRFKYHKPVGLESGADLSKEDVTQIRSLYRGALTAIDDAAAPLVEEILASKRRTILVIMADHGETLYESRRGEGHGNHLFGDEALHIPLVFVDSKNFSPKRITNIVRDIDLTPTLLDLMHLEPGEGMRGKSLMPLARANPGEVKDDRIAFAETGLWFTEEIDGIVPELRMPYPPIERLTEIDVEHEDELVLRSSAESFTNLAKHRMVRDARFKLLYAPTRTGARLLLFDTVADPGETIDVSAARPDVVERLFGELRKIVLTDPATVESRGLFIPRAKQTVDSGRSIRLGGN